MINIPEEFIHTGEGSIEKCNISEWNRIASHILTPVNVFPEDRRSFRAGIKRVRLNRCDLIHVRSSPARIEADLPERSDTLNIQLQFEGATVVSHAGRKQYMPKGSFVLFDPARPSTTEFDRYNEVLTLRVPAKAALERLPFLPEMAGVRIDGVRGPGALFADFLRNAWRELQDAQQPLQDSLEDVIWPLLEIAYYKEGRASEAGSVKGRRRKKIFEIIDNNLCDPDLDIHMIAESAGVSVRYLQMLFSEMSTTPTSYISNRRLDMVKRRLRLEGKNCQVTVAALDAGFNDLSSFCRSFRRRFGITPSECRAGKDGKGGVV